jgi:hypothetical protein
MRSVAAARSLCWLARYLKKFGLFMDTPRIISVIVESITEEAKENKVV